MKRIRTFLAAVVLTVGVLIPIAATPAFASLSCPSGSDDHIGNTANPVLAIFYEEPYTQIAPGTYPNGHVLCVHAGGTTSILVPNLKNVAYTWYHGVEDSVCYGQLFTSYGTWNDCITGIKLSASCHWSLRAYLDANYGSLAVSWTGTGANPDIGIGKNNAISSFKLTYTALC